MDIMDLDEDKKCQKCYTIDALEVQSLQFSSIHTLATFDHLNNLVIFDNIRHF